MRQPRQSPQDRHWCTMANIRQCSFIGVIYNVSSSPCLAAAHRGGYCSKTIRLRARAVFLQVDFPMYERSCHRLWLGLQIGLSLYAYIAGGGGGGLCDHGRGRGTIFWF